VKIAREKIQEKAPKLTLLWICKERNLQGKKFAGRRGGIAKNAYVCIIQL